MSSNPFELNASDEITMLGFWTVFTRSAFTRNEHSASVVITCDFEPVKEESALLVIFVEINIAHLMSIVVNLF